MCLMLWIGTQQPVAPILCTADPDLPACFCGTHPVSPIERLPVCFTSPHVTYVGSHEGCGCGFNKSQFGWEGFADVADVMELLDAMRDEERQELLAQQHSRKYLARLVSASLSYGEVEIYACWAGDENLPADHTEAIRTSRLTKYLTPLREGVLYTVHKAAK